MKTLPDHDLRLSHMPSLNELEEYLDAAGIASKKDSASTLCFTLTVPMSSGKRKAFELTAIQSNSELLIRESGGRFPNFCPNRHINMGGFFCLGFEIDGLPVHDWVSYVKDYLKAQEYVNKYRKWPSLVKEWSHGEAARYQKLVENALRKLRSNNINIDFKKIELREVRPTTCFPNQPHYHLYYDSKLVATGLDNKILNKRAACICTTDGSGKRRHKTIGNCKHQCANILYQIPFNEKRRVLEERKFWKACEAVDCCMTMDDCKLNNNI